MEILAYPIIKIVLILVGGYIAFKTLKFSAEMTASFMTTLVLIATITPGAIAANRALSEVQDVDLQTDHKKVEKMRETILADMMRSAQAYAQYPEKAQTAHKMAITLAG